MTHKDNPQYLRGYTQGRITAKDVLHIHGRALAEHGAEVLSTSKDIYDDYDQGYADGYVSVVKGVGE